jgi:hypothetical protein
MWNIVRYVTFCMVHYFCIFCTQNTPTKHAISHVVYV